MNKIEAADLLGVSPRTLERLVSAGKLRAIYTPGPTGRVLSLDPGEVERLKAERDAPTATPDGTASAPTSPGDRLARLSGAPATADVLTALVAAIDAARPEQRQADAVQAAAGKLLLTLAEAQTLTGLSRARLRSAIDAGALVSMRTGRTWRVKRRDLDSYIDAME